MGLATLLLVALGAPGGQADGSHVVSDEAGWPVSTTIAREGAGIRVMAGPFALDGGDPSADEHAKSCGGHAPRVQYCSTGTTAHTSSMSVSIWVEDLFMGEVGVWIHTDGGNVDLSCSFYPGALNQPSLQDVFCYSIGYGTPSAGHASVNGYTAAPWVCQEEDHDPWCGPLGFGTFPTGLWEVTGHFA